MNLGLLFGASILLLASVLLGDPLPGTLPQGGVVVGGAATITVNGAQVTIDQASNRAITEWSSFSIGEAAGVTVNQPTATSAFLARVVGSNPSEIFGNLTTNGYVYLTNSNGIIFGETATVRAGGLVASTLHISNADFMDGINRFVADAGAGDLIVHGEINAGEFAVGIAPRIAIADATITARELVFVAGNQSSGILHQSFGGGGATLDFRAVGPAPLGRIVVQNATFNGDSLAIDSHDFSATDFEAIVGTLLFDVEVIDFSELSPGWGRLPSPP